MYVNVNCEIISTGARLDTIIYSYLREAYENKQVTSTICIGTRTTRAVLPFVSRAEHYKLKKSKHFD